ncbi:SPOR domain-containing protein [Candidatus Vallotiella sp. (ex Adelges kitamiensis)]|uniref:SPOR domain-containing protein n=1 Tax=Candidatus Vallotiella sp. (ex Adelges kitamiensis) TaxID=2864217 RepID=UPI001CE3A347|nr:SPOR domain-containing protein [Candidatus Vallotia sp. (ex Adelges kitamiensis)]
MLLGIVFGLIIGLAIAIIVEIFFREAPTPFMSTVKAPETTFGIVNNNESFDPNLALASKWPSQLSTLSAIPVPPNTARGKTELQSQLTNALLAEPQIIEIPSIASVTVAQPKSQELLGPDEPTASCSISKPHAFSALAKPPVTSQNIDDASKSNTIYFLQVGAFHTEQAAEKQRAELVLRGFEPKVTRRTSGDVVYYRVRIGPFLVFEDMNNAQRRLSDADINSIIIRIAK